MLKLKNNLLLILGLFSALSLAGDLNKQLIAVAKQIVENVAEVQRLIAAGVDINTVDSYYESTPLFEACANGHLKIVRLLLDQADIKINKATITGLTPLMIASQYGYTAIVEILKKKIAQDARWQGLRMAWCGAVSSAGGSFLAGDDSSASKVLKC